MEIIVLNLQPKSLESIPNERINRSSRPEVLCKEGILENFAKFSGKQTPVPESLF